ncbi:hypothetical protein Zmor_019977 [Zophobas morio]|uniref:Sodium channel protein Nach n=1 Tax=Zophobas morio TaxID=2755281 RepID=A0AA38M8Y2_9CUCU|nr:hypothetical protein Zmor_019977 [Zophobas morio]
MFKLKNNNPASHFRNRLLGPGLVYLGLTSFTAFLLVSVWNRFVDNPTVTSLESSVFPVTRVPYPGVSFCNLNKISKKRAASLADYIVEKTGEKREKVMGYIRFLGFLYDADYNVGSKRHIEEFQGILDGLKLKIKDLMRSLMTPCEEFLQICLWGGVEVNCSTIVHMRLTFEGYCCTFNYIKNASDLWEEHRHPAKLAPAHGTPGMKDGLSVTINNDPDDYFYTTLSSSGVNVHVFIPTDYPDKSSGNLMESLADIGSENFIEVIPTTVRAMKEVMNYNVVKRNCLFEVEQITQFGVYSQSDCFVDCRVRSMMTLCECIPFTIPFTDDSTVCTLLDLPCLSKYQRKWTALVPDHVDAYTFKEQEDGLFCTETCYLSCEATLYEITTSSVRLFDSAGNYTSIHIFYGNRFHSLYQQDVVHYWFDILSSVGGIFGIVMGLSILSIVEGVIYMIKLVVAKW